MKQELSKKLQEVLNSPLEGDKLRLALETEIAKMFPYDHTERSPVKACGLDEDFEFRLVHMGNISEAVEKVEAAMSKRQISYLFLKETIREGSSKSYSDRSSMPELSDWIEGLFRKR